MSKEPEEVFAVQTTRGTTVSSVRHCNSTTIANALLKFYGYDATQIINGLELARREAGWKIVNGDAVMMIKAVKP